VRSLSAKCGHRRIRLSTGTSNRELAQSIEAKLRTEIIEGKYFEMAGARQFNFIHMVEKYRQKHDKYETLTHSEALLPVFGHYSLADINSDMIAEYRHKRLKTVKPATVYRELSLMRRMFNVAR
jgi:hypothetical protein